jgi:hypothetical protein
MAFASKIWEQLKEHKFIVFAVIAGVIFLTYMRGTVSGSSATVDPNAPGGDSSLQEAQLAAQSTMHQTDVQGAAAQAQIAAGSHVAELSYQLQSDANQLNANIASQQMADSLQYLTTHDTLQANYANHALDASLQAKQIDATVQTQTTRTLANALVQQAGIKAQAQVSVAQSQSCAWYNPTCW